MKKTKILFIHHGTGWGGAPNSLIKTINVLDKNIYEAKVLLIKDSIVRTKLEENGIPCIVAQSRFYRKYYSFLIHWVPYYVPFYIVPEFLKMFIFWTLSRFIFAKRELKNIDYDIAHLNSSQITDWLAPCKAKGKVIMHIREPISKGTFGIRYALFTNQMKKYADKIIAISIDNANRIGLPQKTEVVYNFSEATVEKIDLDSYQSKKVLYLGGAAEYKGFYNIVKALDYINTDIKVYFGGNYGNLESSIKLKIKKIIGYGKKQRMAIKKMRNHSNAIELGLVYNISKYYNETCCLVSPFAAAHFARPVIEAYLHKKPAIGTNVEGMAEIIDHNKTGLIVPNKDSKALAEAINYLANNWQIAKEMGELGYCVATEKFTAKNIEKVMCIYNSLL